MSMSLLMLLFMFVTMCFIAHSKSSVFQNQIDKLKVKSMNFHNWSIASINLLFLNQTQIATRRKNQNSCCFAIFVHEKVMVCLQNLSHIQMFFTKHVPAAPITSERDSEGERETRRDERERERVKKFY